jgi:hypothetical protein
MLKLILFTVGLAGGAGGATAWLLSEPSPSQPSGTAMPERLNELKQRLNAALAEGAKAGEETENRIRHEFDTYRRHPDRPGASS